MGGITCNAEGFAGEMGVVDVLEGGERDTNDLLSCSHYPLKGLAAGRVAGAIPHSDAASQNALDGASVEGAHAAILPIVKSCSVKTPVADLSCNVNTAAT